VRYATADGTAVAPVDYQATNGHLEFAPALSSQGGAGVQSVPTKLPEWHIGASAGKRTLSWTAASDAFELQVRDDLSSGSAWQSATEGIQVSGDTRSVSIDSTVPARFYRLVSTLAFGPGETSKTIKVKVNGDRGYEPDENFYVRLSNPSNATIARAEAVGTILNDDNKPTLSIDDVSVQEGDAGTTSVKLTVSLSGLASEPVTVKWTTADGTAVAPGDYAGGNGTLTFAPGGTSQTITVLVNGDFSLDDSVETFSVNLSGAVNASISNSAGSGTGLIIDDDIGT
jgi:hypothetical protein